MIELRVRIVTTKGCAVIEEELLVPAGDVSLAGTLCRPRGEGSFPTFLWIQGSGPIDRDDNIPGQQLNNSKVLAHFLAGEGFASLRCDKRGIGKSGGDYYSAGHSRLVDDSLACLQAMSELACCDSHKLFVIGHSMGSIMAPQLAARFPALAGIVMLAPYIGRGDALLMAQARAVKSMLPLAKGFKGKLLRAYCRLFDPVRGQEKFIRRVKASTKDIERVGLQKQPMRWFREMLALETAAIYQGSRCPALLIAGAKDFQCPVEDVALIEQCYGGPLHCCVVDDMSHLLRREPYEPSIFNYADQLAQEIHPDLVEEIHSWLKTRIGDAMEVPVL